MSVRLELMPPLLNVNNRRARHAVGIDDLTGIGPYSVYPRTSGIEANQVVNLCGGPYTCRNYRARARVVFQNKNVMCQYRAVGHPIATAVTEGEALHGHRRTYCKETLQSDVRAAGLRMVSEGGILFKNDFVIFDEAHKAKNALAG